MKYLERVVSKLLEGVKKELRNMNVTDIEAEHTAALLIQILVYCNGEFTHSQIARIGLNAIRKEKDVYTKIDSLDEKTDP
jgi:hypothetical protein